MQSKQAFKWLVVLGACLGAKAGLAQQSAPAANPDATSNRKEAANAAQPADVNLTRTEGMVMLDYQVIRVPDNASIDLMGFHFMNRMNDWLYLGVGGYAPLVKGEYGGFMAFDVTAYAQRKIAGNLFVDGGVSMGGGGGGKSMQQSKLLSGRGGFVKGSLGFGYDFKDFSTGANVSRMKFSQSAIDETQLNIFLQVPFSYASGPYASSGDRFMLASLPSGRDVADGAGENMLTVGLDNYAQIDPVGSNKGAINVADLQFSHFMTKGSYWHFSLGAGYHGLPLYNQVLGGVGYRAAISAHVNLYAELGIGSGGYATDTIDTGSGLLVYPKLSAEYLLDRNFGLALSAGDLLAPNGSSKNHTFGAALNYHIRSGDAGASDLDEGVYRGFRVSLLQEIEFNVKFRGKTRDKIDLLALQVDQIVSDHVYIPVQGGVAYSPYLGFPGYGELAAGVGVQNKYSMGDRFRFFGQVLVGTNVHGLIVKPGVGLNYGLSDHLALYGAVGQTIGVTKDKFSAAYAGLGVTYRFSVPSL